MFSAFLNPKDVLRVSITLRKLSAHGFIGVLTGGAATEIHLLHRRETECRRLNDLDFVVESFASIPESLAQDFLFHHVHPDAPEGKTLLQLIDQEQRLRIDLFRQFGTTLSRAEIMEGPLGSLKVISLEDLVARTTSLVVGNLRRGSVIDRKHARSFLRLAGLGDPAKLEMAWGDHRQSEAASFSEAVGLGHLLLDRHPELVIREEYSAEVTLCLRCRDMGLFRRARPDLIVDILGHG